MTSQPEVEEPPARVLIVDDDRMSQMMLTRNLRQAGYAVESASDGAGGLERLRAQPFDLVILDYVMPDMDGYEVLATIVADERLREVPVVMVSGIDDATNAATLVEAGAADYLTKPIDSGLLRARASRCIEAKRSREREQRLHAEIEASYAKLRELEQLREGLTHMIVHDLRTPLTSMLASIKTVTQLGDQLAPERKARLLVLAQRGGDALIGMINDLLDVHKLEAGGDVLKRAPGDLAATIARAREQVEALTERSGLELRVRVPDGLRQPDYDPAKLERVLVNLLGNAAKATAAGGAVMIDVSSNGDAVTIEIADTGVGIAPEHLARIFEKFYRVDVPKRDAGASTGLGLTFCKMVVEAHGGEIRAASEPGKGTTIAFTLPYS